MPMSPVLLRPVRKSAGGSAPTPPTGLDLTTAPSPPVGVGLVSSPAPPTSVILETVPAPPSAAGLLAAPGGLVITEADLPQAPTGVELVASPRAPSGVQLAVAPDSPTSVTAAPPPGAPTGVGLLTAPSNLAASPAEVDPYISDVVLLLQDSLVDQSLNGSTVTAIGTAALTTSAKVGSHAITFPTNTDRIEAISGPIGTSDYTVEFWLYLTELPTGAVGTAARQLFEANPDVTDAAAPNSCFGMRVELDNGSYRLRAYRHSTAADIYGPLPSSGLNTWRHVAICRDGTSTRLYADGVEVGYSTVQNGLDWTSTKLVFAAGETGAGAWGAKCVMDEIRVTIGTARYTANFTPPDTEFPTS